MVTICARTMQYCPHPVACSATGGCPVDKKVEMLQFFVARDLRQMLMHREFINKVIEELEHDNRPS